MFLLTEKVWMLLVDEENMFKSTIFISDNNCEGYSFTIT